MPKILFRKIYEPRDIRKQLLNCRSNVPEILRHALHFIICMSIQHVSVLRFDVHMSVHRKYISEVQPTRCNVFSIYLFL